MVFPTLDSLGSKIERYVSTRDAHPKAVSFSKEHGRGSVLTGTVREKPTRASFSRVTVLPRPWSVLMRLGRAGLRSSAATGLIRMCVWHGLQWMGRKAWNIGLMSNPRHTRSIETRSNAAGLGK